MNTRHRDPNYVKGVFSTQEIKKIGTGTTTRRTVQKSYWFIESLEDGKLECQPLNGQFIPAGAKKIITRDELMTKFSPEPEFYMSSVYPKMQEMQESLDNGDAHRKKGEHFSAENEYSGVLAIDEDNVRANFGIGLTYLERGEGDKAKNIFERLVKLEGAFQEKHKHLFNEFGISLRKSALLHEALEYYNKALELTQGDEHLHFNVARTYLELKDYDNCMKHLLMMLEKTPQNETGLKFLDWMVKKDYVSAAYAAQAAQYKQ